MSDRVASRGCAAVVIAIVAASQAAAATLDEADLAGGRFGGAWNAPTEVGAGFDTIRGTGNQNVYDNFVFTRPAGWGADAELPLHGARGPRLLLFGRRHDPLRHQPFRWGWDGNSAGTVQVDYYRPSRDYVLDLGDGFSGKLFLALNFTHGATSATRSRRPRTPRPRRRCRFPPARC